MKKTRVSIASGLRERLGRNRVLHLDGCDVDGEKVARMRVGGWCGPLLGSLRGATSWLPLAVCLGTYPVYAQSERPLFDGETLAGWEVSDFVSPGTVEVRNGTLVLGRGEPLTGITWAGEFPKMGYELTLEAMRLEGSDFFSAITFPVGNEPCTLVIGGWGGSVVGLSSIEGTDASENETGRWVSFENGRWYLIRLRVTREKIEAWIDDEQVIDFPHRGRLLSIRIEVLPSRPFGIATWQTSAALRNIRLRTLAEPPAGSVRVLRRALEPARVSLPPPWRHPPVVRHRLQPAARS